MQEEWSLQKRFGKNLRAGVSCSRLVYPLACFAVPEKEVWASHVLVRALPQSCTSVARIITLAEGEGGDLSYRLFPFSANLGLSRSQGLDQGERE